MEFKVLGRVRKVAEGYDAQGIGSSDDQIVLTGQLEQLVAQGPPPYQETVRMGRAFWTGTTTAIAAATTTPTTVHHMAIYNNAADGGESLVIDWVAASNVASAATAAQATLLGNVGMVRETAPTNAGLTIKKLNGFGTSNDTNVYTILNATALPATTGLVVNWFPLGPNATKPGAATTPGYTAYARIDGGIIVPPGRYFAVAVLANVSGETFNTYIGWHEVQLALG